MPGSGTGISAYMRCGRFHISVSLSSPATVNSVIICVIAVRTAQFGFVPANVFCIAMSVINLHSWRKRERNCDPI